MLNSNVGKLVNATFSVGQSIEIPNLSEFLRKIGF